MGEGEGRGDSECLDSEWIPKLQQTGRFDELDVVKGKEGVKGNTKGSAWATAKGLAVHRDGCLQTQHIWEGEHGEIKNLVLDMLFQNVLTTIYA